MNAEDHSFTWSHLAAFNLKIYRLSRAFNCASSVARREVDNLSTCSASILLMSRCVPCPLDKYICMSFCDGRDLTAGITRAVS